MSKRREEPEWVESERRYGSHIIDRSLNQFLTTDLVHAGYELHSIEAVQGRDPWYLYGPDGRIIKEWEKCPSIIDVWDVAQKDRTK